MKPEVVLELLEAAAEQLKVRVTYEPLQTSVVHGGLCRVKGEYRIIVDKRASAEERVTTLATALAQVMKNRSPSVTEAGAEGAADARIGESPGENPGAGDEVLELHPKVRELLRMYEPAPARTAGPAGGRTAA